jgi:adenosine deaminase
MKGLVNGRLPTNSYETFKNCKGCIVNQNNKVTRSALQAMPKIDLHRHLEGSLRLNTLFDIAREYNLSFPCESAEALRPFVQITNDRPDHEIFLSKFGVLRHFYRSPEIIHRVVYEAIADAAADNVHYLELRFSPQALSRVADFDLGEVTDWVIFATETAARDFNIEVNLITTLVRHEPFEQACYVAEIACARAGKGIVGLDLAGDEIKFPPAPFIPIFKKAKEAGLGVTIHAGEWASADGVGEAIEQLYSDRIGHGVRAVENEAIARMAVENNIAFEVCLTSNLQTGVMQHMHQHPLHKMLDFGMMVTLNTDDPTVSNISLTDEYIIAVEQLGMKYEDLRAMTLNAAKAAFLSENGRSRLTTYFEKLL